MEQEKERKRGRWEGGHTKQLWSQCALGRRESLHEAASPVNEYVCAISW